MATFYELIGTLALAVHPPISPNSGVLKTFREVLIYYLQHENCLVLQVLNEDYDHGSLLGDLWMSFSKVCVSYTLSFVCKKKFVLPSSLPLLLRAQIMMMTH